MRTIMLATAATLALAACATPENRVKTALLQAGLSESVSACMATRMTDRLTIAQLQKLAQAGQGAGPVGQMSLSELSSRVQSIGDPEIVSVVSSAAVGCALTS
ncbi:MAG TPA: hypothetical protein VEZ48_04160 [Sphingomonadaceae bacterium]|nr:hypothetical protein [Sphingomonadaceae bacterium]